MPLTGSTKGSFIATQLNSTRRRVELRRYKRALSSHTCCIQNYNWRVTTNCQQSKYAVCLPVNLTALLAGAPAVFVLPCSNRNRCFEVILWVRCASVRLFCCLSVTLVYCIKTSNRILKPFSQSDCHIILVFPYQTLWQYSRKWGNSRDFRQVSGFGIDDCWTVDCRQHFDGGLGK